MSFSASFKGTRFSELTLWPPSTPWASLVPLSLAFRGPRASSLSFTTGLQCTSCVSKQEEGAIGAMGLGVLQYQDG